MFITFEPSLVILNLVLECKQIEFIRFLNKYHLLALKYFFKVRFACEIKLILPGPLSIMTFCYHQPLKG